MAPTLLETWEPHLQDYNYVIMSVHERSRSIDHMQLEARAWALRSEVKEPNFATQLCIQKQSGTQALG